MAFYPAIPMQNMINAPVATLMHQPVAYAPYLQSQNEQASQIQVSNSVIPTMYSQSVHYPGQNLPTQNPSNDNWTTVENKKKRPRGSPDNRSYKQTKLNDYWLNPTTTNRFEMLDNEQSADINQDVNTNQNRENRPPPIFIQGVKNISPLTNLLQTICKDNYEIKVLNNDQVKVQPKNTEAYTSITKALIDKKTEFHTYKIKEERSFRVVLKNIHYSVDPEELKTEIEQHGHTVTNIYNIKHYRTKDPLPMFFIDLKPDKNNKDIYDIKYLVHSKITFEPPRKKGKFPNAPDVNVTDIPKDIASCDPDALNA